MNLVLTVKDHKTSMDPIGSEDLGEVGILLFVFQWIEPDIELQYKIKKTH